jgi:hypothetical protein
MPKRPPLLWPALPLSPRNLLHALPAFLWVWLTLMLSLYLSWFALAKGQFLYPLWYQVAGIEAHIQHYAPQNRFRKGFEHTDAATHQALFAGIVQAIHQNGQGLEQLYYTTPDRPHQAIALLHRDEIGHLEDVARLVHQLKTLGWGVLCLWLLLSARLWRQRKRPSAQTAVGNLGVGLSIILAILLVLGPKQVFYQLHIWIFPPEHPWFFYYQDSLMSTLMKAPDLFAYIAASLLILALLLFGLLFALLRFWPFQPKPHTRR